MKSRIGMELMMWGVMCVFGIVSLYYYIRQCQPIIISSDKIESTIGQQIVEQVSIEEIEKIDINLTSQKLNIYPTIEEFITIEQLSNKKLNKDELIKIKVRNKELRIEKEPVRQMPIGIREEINLYIPKAYNENLKIQMSSGETSIEGIQIDNLRIDKTSGSTKIKELNARLVETELSSGSFKVEESQVEKLIGKSTSGSISIRKILANEIDMKSSSGSVNIDGNCDKVNIVSTSGSSQVELKNMPDEMSIIKTSGSSKLALPENKGFELDYENTSGNLKSDFELDTNQLIDRNGTYVYKDGMSKIKIRTTSGSTKIYKR